MKSNENKSVTELRKDKFYLVVFSDGALTESAVNKAKRDMQAAGVGSTWVKNRNRVNPSAVVVHELCGLE